MENSITCSVGHPVKYFRADDLVCNERSPRLLSKLIGSNQQNAAVVNSHTQVQRSYISSLPYSAETEVKMQWGNTRIRVHALRELGAPRAWRRDARLAEMRDARDMVGGIQTRIMIKPCWHAASTRTGKRTSGNREPLHQQRNILFLRILPTDTPIAILRRDVHVRVALRTRQDDRHRVVH